MAANQTDSVQAYYSQLAALEQSRWLLMDDIFFRVSAGTYAYNGKTYARDVANSTVASYTDAVTIAVTPASSDRALRASLRRFIDTPIFIGVRKATQVCCDQSNNLYFSDDYNHKVWKLDATSGSVIHIAGNGTGGYGGDGGPATEAQLSYPAGVCVDSQGNVYIADTANQRIRKVSAFGFISTIAGDGSSGLSGNEVPASTASIKDPNGMYVDAANNLYFTETGHNMVRKIDASPPYLIHLVAGDSSGGYAGDGGPATAANIKLPEHVCADKAGNIFIADTGNHVIRAVNVHDGKISTLTGTGGSASYNGDAIPAATALLNAPAGVAVSGARGGGAIYISDTANNRIRRMYLKTVKELY
jgi:sugar lactone lactonase YvrE